MRNLRWKAAVWAGSGLSVLMTACGSGTITTTATTYVLTVNSTNPASGVAITVSPADNNGAANGTTTFTRTYNAGTSVTLTAPATSGGNAFASWSGCASTVTCTVTMSANTTVTANYTTPVTATYVLTVNSTNPASGVAITVSPADNNGAANGTTSFTRTYNAGTFVTLTAPAASGGNTFASWSGCASASTVTCTVTMSANTTVTANFVVPVVVVTPNPVTVTIGATQQFTALVSGTASSSVTWSVAAPSGSSLSPGTISTSGLYTTPYPAPASVTVTATSTQGATNGNSGSATVTLTAPATATGPALTVNVASPTHAISPFIYGWNGGSSNEAEAEAFSLPIDRWGGNEATSYNYLYDLDAKGNDWYFENFIDNSNPLNTPAGAPNTSTFNTQVENDAAVGATSMGTVPIIGWEPADNTNCSFSVAKYGAQQSVDPYRPDCGNGVLTNGNRVVNDPTDTYYAVTPATFDGTWVQYLVNKFGNAASGGVAIYELDNEPSWWDGVHIDVHPLPFTYDEVTNNGIAAAEAVKTADPTAGVSGPVMDYWWDYFYSKKDVESGWGSGGGPCWQPWSNPVDREAHGGVPFIEYYLQQFAAASTTYGSRLLDYLDLHTYYAATYDGNGVAFSTAGDTGEQQARLNSTRVFWDPAYTDPNEPQPNYPTDPNYYNPTTHGNCNIPLQAPQLIPMAQAWVAEDYPGTKVAFTEYNWGGQESINGALAQADILGIFGMYGLDLATLWGPPDPTTQVPGLMAYEIYRNYDGKHSMFGDTALASTSANQGTLSVYGALRASDNAVTVVVINKTYGDLTSTLWLDGLFPPGTSAQSYLYSNANLAAIVGPTAVTVTPALGSSPWSISNYTFPAQSITLFVVSQ
ncbi:MAG TPA: glycoside hydrolase family 44 protein [Terracidiphilus sp.]|nr:glycoside hydrolase family 44 protein [Terracidiphilus sp.]